MSQEGPLISSWQRILRRLRLRAPIPLLKLLFGACFSKRDTLLQPNPAQSVPPEANQRTLKIIAVEHGKPKPARSCPRTTLQAKLDKQSLKSKKTSRRDRLRLLRTLDILRTLPPGQTVDIGCGDGFIAQSHPHTTAVDACSTPLKKLTCPTVQALLPDLPFDDQTFDTALCTNVIADLPRPLHRLAINELSRILKPGGHLLISTDLDRRSPDALDHFADLVSTEFTVTHHHIFFHLTKHALLLAQKRSNQL